MTLNIKRPEKVVPLCLDASLQAEWEQAEANLIQARKAPTGDRMTGNAEVTRLAERVRDLEAQMLAEVVHFRLRALPRSQWAQIVAGHPPKPDNAADRAFGVDREGFFEALLAYVDERDSKIRTIVAVKRGEEDVNFDPASDWTGLADEMTDRQYSDFADAAYNLNRGSVSVPFSKVASIRSRASSGNSGQPESAA